jgi:hypothetical protein
MLRAWLAVELSEYPTELLALVLVGEAALLVARMGEVVRPMAAQPV